jgi:hypothetical protein
MLISKKPHELVFAGNPMRYLLAPESSGGGGGGQTDGQLSVVQITFTDIDTEVGHSMTIDMMGSQRQFTLSGEPSTENDFPVADDRHTPLDWAAICFAYLLNDVRLNASYAISQELDGITLTARQPSPLYDMALLDSNIRGITLTMLQYGMTGTGQTVEGVRMQVYRDGTQKIGEDYKPVNSDGEVKFEIQEYIFAHLRMAPAPRFRISWPGGQYRYYDDYILKYRTVFCDKVDGEFQARTYCDPDHTFCYALPGGLNREDLVANASAGTDFFALTTTRKKFLTWAPPSRVTDKTESFSLFFAFQQPEHSSFRIKANIYNDSVGQTIEVTPLIAIMPWKVVELFVGYTQLGLDAYLSGTVSRWEVYLTDGDDGIISDIREFILDKRYHETIRYFRFRNSWGAYDSLRCTGMFETSVEHEREKVNIPQQDTETQFNAPISHTLVREMQSYKANSGWLSREYLNYLRDFMLSGDIYEISSDRLLKCLLTAKKTSLFKDRQYNYSLNFEFERGYEDFFFQTSP